MAKWRAFIDRGANGGNAGDNIGIISEIRYTEDIHGFASHHIKDNQIINARGVVNTQKKEMIAILHLYAYAGKKVHHF